MYVLYHWEEKKKMPALFRKLCRIRVKPPDAFTAGHETEEDGTAIGNFIRLPQDIAVQIRTRDNQSVVSRYSFSRLLLTNATYV